MRMASLVKGRRIFVRNVKKNPVTFMQYILKMMSYSYGFPYPIEEFIRSEIKMAIELDTPSYFNLIFNFKKVTITAIIRHVSVGAPVFHSWAGSREEEVGEPAVVALLIRR